MKLDFERCKRAITEAAAPHFRGRIENVSGVMVEAKDAPEVPGVGMSAKDGDLAAPVA